MEEYVVTLRNKEDLDDFYNDMETPGGDLYIPDRAVDLQLRRQISRNTHYMLTPEEVIELKQDPRVWDVKSANHIRSAQGSYDGFEEGGTFVAKVLAGGAEGELQKLLKLNFDKVANVKPPASRSDSSEKFVVATGFRGRNLPSQSDTSED